MRQINLQEVVIFTVALGTDAQGFQIVSDGHGGWTKKPIPGNGPGPGELRAAGKAFMTAASINNPEFSSAMLNAAVKLALPELGKLEPGKTTVVVVAV